MSRMEKTGKDTWESVHDMGDYESFRRISHAAYQLVSQTLRGPDRAAQMNNPAFKNLYDNIIQESDYKAEKEDMQSLVQNFSDLDYVQAVEQGNAILSDPSRLHDIRDRIRNQHSEIASLLAALSEKITALGGDDVMVFIKEDAGTQGPSL